MTVAEAIRLAGAWQESPAHPNDPVELERIATAFSFALTYVSLERDVANDRLAEAGYGHGPLNQRVEDAIAAALSRRS